jgi:DNA-binding HxlR family transcriptional regulator
MPLKRRKNKSRDPLCPLSECMSYIDAAWAPHVIWYLGAGPRRFSELRADIPAISAKVLTQRLRELEDRGVIARKVMPTSPPTVEYELTDFGQEFRPLIEAIEGVAQRLTERRAKAESS